MRCCVVLSPTANYRREETPSQEAAVDNPVIHERTSSVSGRAPRDCALSGRQKRLGCYFSRHFNLELGLLHRDYLYCKLAQGPRGCCLRTRKWSIGSNHSPSSVIALISISGALRFAEQTVLNWRIGALSVSALRVLTRQLSNFGVIDLCP